MSKKSALAATGFFRLWTAESISLTGAQVTTLALPLLAVLTMDAGAWETSLLTAAAGAANLVFGLSAGVWADRYERTLMMHVANLGRLIVLVAVPLLAWADALDIWVLALAAFLVGAFTLLFDSAMVPYMPRLVGAKNIGPANSWLEGSEAVGDVAGPGIAGTLVQWLSAPVALLVDAATYVVSSVALLGMPKAHPEKPEGAEKERHWDAVVSGLKLLRGDRYQWPLAIAATHFNFFGAMFAALYLLYAIRDVEMNPFTLGAMTMLGGAAGLIAAAVNQRVITRLGIGPTLVLSYALPGITAIPVGFAHLLDKPVGLTLIGISQFSWVFGIVVMHVCVNTIRQTLVPDHLMGRITASVRFMSWGVNPLGALVGGAMASTALGLANTLVVASVGLLTSMVWPLLSQVRKLRTLGQEESETSPEEPVATES
ncbi:MFS transporter [Streptomyces sp. NBC_01618]|uniref:MFS transporter n=1 Tax=Streptomyces sp. NBC_01618 TaxID=2975900 RepID=UPI00386B2B79|nr:MFS transporter [Streptomyces sp. NBC_01618]